MRRRAYRQTTDDVRRVPELLVGPLLLRVEVVHRGIDVGLIDDVLTLASRCDLSRIGRAQLLRERAELSELCATGLLACCSASAVPSAPWYPCE